MRSFRFPLALATLPFLLVSCCWQVRSFHGVRVEPADLRRDASTLVAWPADADADQFRYLITSWEGDVEEDARVGKTDLPPGSAFFGHLPQSLGSAVVLLPAQDLQRLRPHAEALLAAIVRHRPKVATSVTPAAADELDADLLAVSDAAGLAAALRHAGAKRMERRQPGFEELAARIAWMPYYYVVPLENGSWSVMLSDPIHMGSQAALAEQDWDGLTSVLARTATEEDPARVLFALLEPEHPSAEIVERVRRLMNWPEQLDVAELYWARHSGGFELASDATANDVLSAMTPVNLGRDESIARMEVRGIYNAARIEAGELGPHPRF